MKGKHSSFFWISYSDLMISLFFVMLVLFVLANMKAVKNYKELEQISESIDEIAGEYFEYDPKKRNFSLKVDTIKFKTASAEFSKGAEKHLVLAGKELSEKIKYLEKKYKDKGFDVRYTIILEGMSSYDAKIGDTWTNYQYSYERAWQVKQLWNNNKIDFGKNTEIQISGTGIEGLSMIEPKKSVENQKVLIHVIPKIGKFKVEK